MSSQHHKEQHRTPHGKEEESNEESLTTLLDEDQRGELTLLIASATAAMRKTITSSFDANVRGQDCPHISIC